KILQLAQSMANAVGRGGGAASREKAHRRAKAALEVFPGPLGKKIYQMFMDAADVKFLPRATESTGQPKVGTVYTIDVGKGQVRVKVLKIIDGDVQARQMDVHGKPIPAKPHDGLGVTLSIDNFMKHATR